MANAPNASSRTSESEAPTDLLAGLPGLATAPTPTASAADRLPLKIFGVMTVTSLGTFATLATGYQLLFAR
jgi:hypothetical protein